MATGNSMHPNEVKACADALFIGPASKDWQAKKTSPIRGGKGGKKTSKK